MTWSFDFEPGGLVWPNPGDDRPALRDALWDGVGSLSPAGVAPSVSTYWIDRAVAALASSAPRESVVASGNAWSLLRNGDRVVVQFDYADEGEEPADTIPVDELSAGLTAYRDAVVRAIERCHKLDERWWAQRSTIRRSYSSGRRLGQMLTPEVLEQSSIPHEAKGTAWLSAYLPLRPMISMR